MKIVTWNVRGLSAPNKRCLVKRHLDKIYVDIVLLQETKISSQEGEKFIKYCKKWCGLFQSVEGSTGGLGIL